MRGTKIRKQNLRYGKELKRKMKSLGIKYYDFTQLSGYYVFSFHDKSIIHFSVGDYKFGVWLDQKKVFAEHLGNIDKFKWTATNWTRNLCDMDDVIDLINEVLAYNGTLDAPNYEDGEIDLIRWRNYLKEDEADKKNMVLVDLDYLHKLKNLNPNFKQVWFSNNFTDVQTTKLNIVLRKNISNKEISDIEQSMITLCGPIYNMRGYSDSKIYQTLLNGRNIEWFISKEI